MIQRLLTMVLSSALLALGGPSLGFGAESGTATPVWPSPPQAPSAAQDVAGETCHVPGGTERREVLDAMRGAVECDLRQPVIFKVSTIHVCGEWSFAVVEPLKRDGRPIQWQSTICKGDVSHLVGALSRKGASGWGLQDYALCPTDVAWESWPEKYGAPQAVFGE